MRLSMDLVEIGELTGARSTRRKEFWEKRFSRRHGARGGLIGKFILFLDIFDRLINR